MEKHDRSVPIENWMYREVDEALAAVGEPVSKLFPEGASRRCLLRREANSRLGLFRTTPPRRVPERPVQDLRPRIAAPIDRKIVRFRR